jgi:hypothetical protein
MSDRSPSLARLDALDGSKLWFADWMGGPTLAKVTNCRLANLAGDMRRTVYVTGEADTWFSIPACCYIGGKRVTGYLTGDGDSDGKSIVFRHTYY